VASQCVENIFSLPKEDCAFINEADIVFEDGFTLTSQGGATGQSQETISKCLEDSAFLQGADIIFEDGFLLSSQGGAMSHSGTFNNDTNHVVKSSTVLNPDAAVFVPKDSCVSQDTISNDHVDLHSLCEVENDAMSVDAFSSQEEVPINIKHDEKSSFVQEEEVQMILGH